MKVLAVNGSPKGRASNTWKLTQAFLKGMERAAQEADEALQVTEVDTGRLRIEPCRGCFACWKRTPGRCCIHDDMEQVLAQRIEADVTIWSFPLYYFGVPGPLKTLLDRQLPLVLPFIEDRQDEVGGSRHPQRYAVDGKRQMAISTCGFYTAQGNYDGVTHMLDHICGKGQYETVFCGQGELFRVPRLKPYTEAYLCGVEQAGYEYYGGEVSRETRERLKKPILSKDVFEKMANESW